MKHSKHLKDKDIQSLLEPNRKPISKLSEELDISEVTLYYWDRQLKNGNMRKKQPQSFTDKQDIVFIYQSLTEEDKRIWLRIVLK